ncbi:hypothetical protein [Austwickia sp. TVS 96-490-7B]|uniref:hypothetical protein n=1 Tax=Austwickia sp. TVS 96-490-7B TaxID=2830843 RepID=UPI001C59FFC6|nr:hypothetical protein [Austwickia sp. TVS 96-490-7B]
MNDAAREEPSNAVVDSASASRPPVRRVGRRRVVTSDMPGVCPQLDPTYDDRPADGDRGDEPSPTAGTSSGEPALDARDRWIVEQRPPHWG